MTAAASAGLMPDHAERLTLGEVLIVIEGYHEREKQSLISRINAILRAFSKKQNPYKGLTSGQSGPRGLSYKEAIRRWLWQPEPDDK